MHLHHAVEHLRISHLFQIICSINQLNIGIIHQLLMIYSRSYYKGYVVRFNFYYSQQFLASCQMKRKKSWLKDCLAPDLMKGFKLQSSNPKTIFNHLPYSRSKSWKIGQITKPRKIWGKNVPFLLISRTVWNVNEYRLWIFNLWINTTRWLGCTKYFQ